MLRRRQCWLYFCPFPNYESDRWQLRDTPIICINVFIISPFITFYNLKFRQNTLSDVHVPRNTGREPLV